MSWQNRTTEQRTALRSRRAKRRVRKSALVDALWVEKAKRVRTAADAAAYEYDLARRNIKAMQDPGEQVEAWTALKRRIARFNEALAAADGDIRIANLRSESADSGGPHADARTRVRQS